MSGIFHVDFNDDAESPWHDALRDFGYSPSFEDAFRQIAQEGEVPARIVEEQRDRYRIVRLGEDGCVREDAAQASARLAREAASAAQLPAVGDWTAVQPGQGGDCLIRSVLPRKSAFMRKTPGDVSRDRIDAQVVAANIDAAFIVAAAGHDWNLRRIERYIALTRAAGALPVLVIAKSDLAEDHESLLADADRAAPGVRTAMVCATEGRGLNELSFALEPGKTVVLLGSSGAGKSTLLNALAGENLSATNEVRKDDQRGRHTTTHRQLFRLSSGLGKGALIIDTPGMRELQLWADAEAVDSAFPELEALAAGCRFRDCRHENEPDCAVLAALNSGELDAGRYGSWRKLSKEAAFLQSKGDGSARDAERRRWRSIEMTRRSFAKETAAREKKSRG